jgi:hypothetical protein
MSDEQVLAPTASITTTICQMCQQAFVPRVENQRPFCNAECEGLWMSELRRLNQRPQRMSRRGGYFG